MQGVRKKVGERDDNQDLSQQREEDGLLFLVQRLESCLSDILQIHENKCGKIQVQSMDGVRPQSGIRAEDTDQGVGGEQDRAPGQCRVGQHKQSHDTDCLADMAGSCPAVVVADDGRSAFHDGVDGRLDHLPCAGYDRHDRDEEIAADVGQDAVAGDGYKAVCQKHDEAGGAQAYDISGDEGIF